MRCVHQSAGANQANPRGLTLRAEGVDHQNESGASSDKTQHGSGIAHALPSVNACTKVLEYRKEKMAYFPNGSSAEVFDRQCFDCAFGEDPCPVWLAQQTGNYKQCGNEDFEKTMNCLVSEDGECQMRKALLKKGLFMAGQLDLFKDKT